MEPLQPRNGGSSQLSTTALAAILTGVGIVMLGLLVGLVFLLVRAVRTHKRLLSDLEERGVSLAQQRGSKQDPVSEPRSVLRRNTILPFNSRSGWGTLQSVETINPSEQQPPPQYVPPEPAGSKSTRLSWSFSARRSSSKAVRMGKLKVPRLSTVIEDPKLSPLITVMGTPKLESPVPLDSKGQPSSDLPLLQNHPAFRPRPEDGRHEVTQSNTLRPEPLRRSVSAAPLEVRGDSKSRANRSMSVADLPHLSAREEAESSLVSRYSRSDLHTRSSSVCSQASGNAPESNLPPLPLEIMEISRTKSENRNSCLLKRSPSKISVSSFESAGSSILANHSSFLQPQASDGPSQSSTKRDWKNAMISGTRPFRDTLSLHRKDQCPHGSLESNPPQLPSLNLLQQDSRSKIGPSTLIKSSSTQSIGRMRAVRSTAAGRSSPSDSPLTVRSLATPKRKSSTRVSANGSPQERQKSSVLQSVSGNEGSPKRQLSQTSTRSSNGNPFQWDPTPLSSGKPSALKGSPSARKGHRRQNCVRISLAPTILGPTNTAAIVTQMNDIKEESPTLSNKKNASIDSSSTIRNLSQPPSSKTFAPDLKVQSNTIQDSSTLDSNSLSLLDFEEDDVDSPALAQVLPEFFKHQRNSLSYGSISSIPMFPVPGQGTGSKISSDSPLSKSTLPQHSDNVNEEPKMPNTPFLPSCPFEGDSPRSSLSVKRPKEDALDQTPRLPNPMPTNTQILLPPTNIDIILSDSLSTSNINDEEDTVTSQKDSPPCSPSSEALPQQDRSVYDRPIADIIIQENVSDAIDPSLLIKVETATVNGATEKDSGTMMKTLNSNRNSCLGLGIPGSRLSTLQPLLEGEALQSDGILMKVPLVSDGSPPRPLRSSILKLRRMNSDCERTGRAERRYLHLGRDDSLRLSIDENWLEEGDSGDIDEDWYTEEDKKLLGSTLDDWELQASKKMKKQEETHLPISSSGNSQEQKIDSSKKNKTEIESKGFSISSSSPQTGTPAPTPASTPNTTPTITSAAAQRSSAIWEDGEKFWNDAYKIANPTNTTLNNITTIKPLPSSSPLLSKLDPLTQPPNRLSPTPSPRTTTKPRHHDFDIAAELLNSPSQEDITSTSDGKKLNVKDNNNNNNTPSGANQNRKRSVLGVGTPNVRIHVQPPLPPPPPPPPESGGSSSSGGNSDKGGIGAPPSALYDGDDWGP